jgi:uncharacterized protein (DUF1330 family)
MKAFLILDLSIHDLPRFMEYAKKIPGFIKKHSGRYVVQGEAPTVMEGDWHPERVVVIEFPSRAGAKEFLEDPEAQPLFALRHETTTGRLILVDGCA